MKQVIKIFNLRLEFANKLIYTLKKDDSFAIVR